MVSLFFAYVNVIDVCSSEVPLLTSCGLLPYPLLLFVASYTVFLSRVPAGLCFYLGSVNVLLCI